MNDFETGRQPVIVTGVRTPFLKSGGAYAALSGHSLAAAPMAELRRRCDLAPDGVDLVTLGMVVQDVDATNAAREAMLSAGFSSRVPAWTVSMAGVSPNVGVGSICDQILLGRVDSALACGADNFSDLPVRFGRSLRQRAVSLATARSLAERLRILAGIRPGDLLPHVPSATDLTTGLTMGECAERMARRFGVDRNDSDAYALRSHRLATEAWTTGRFADEVMAIDLANGSRVERDDTPRSDTTLERLGALRPSFVEDGIITAGNASGLTDGAAALLLMSTAAAARAGHDPLARIIDYQFTGVADLRDEMLLGPAMAIPPLLHRHGLAMQDIEVFELHEAFAATVVKCRRDLGIDDLPCLAGFGLAVGASFQGHPLEIGEVKRRITGEYEDATVVSIKSDRPDAQELDLSLGDLLGFGPDDFQPGFGQRFKLILRKRDQQIG